MVTYHPLLQSPRLPLCPISGICHEWYGEIQSGKGRVATGPVRCRSAIQHRRLSTSGAEMEGGQEREHATGVWDSDCKHHEKFLTEQKQPISSSPFSRGSNAKKLFLLETNPTTDLGSFSYFQVECHRQLVKNPTQEPNRVHTMPLTVGLLLPWRPLGTSPL